MKRLKCPDCGGQVEIQTSPEGHVLGRCRQCANEFVIDAKGRQHVIVEHRLADQPSPSYGRRTALGVGAALLVGGISASFGLSPMRRSTDEMQPDTKVIFDVGGEGPGAGQFRDYVVEVGVDSLGRAAVIDNGERVYIFGPDGQFISHYMLDGPREGKFCAVLPSGNIIIANNHRLVRLAMESGDILETVETKSNPRGWGAFFCATVEGGIAAYSTTGDSFHNQSNDPVKDQVIIYGPDLKERRILSGLHSQAIALDPMVNTVPEVTSIAVDPAGSIYLNIRANEDTDIRGGIFEFNADGRLQRRIEVEQSWHGNIMIGSDQTLWYSDPWRSDLQRIKTNVRQVLHIPPPLGAVSAFALYPDGDLAVTTMNHRFARVEVLLP